MNEVILKMQGINKSFPGVNALKNVQLEIRKGELHALLGENGAGKSTLMKILTGVYKKDSGSILYKGNEVEFSNPREAMDAGISIIFQEFNLLPHLTVAQNIFIGREPRTGIKGVLDEKKLNQNAKEIIDSLNLNINPTTKVSKLSVAEQQMVEIAKALSTNSEILVLDEPTAALTESEILELFRIIDELKKKGVGLIYISHRMEELEKIANRCTVMRDGTYIDTVNYKDTTLDKLIAMMVGRDITEKFPKRDSKIGEVILEAKNITRGKALKNVSFSVRKGEILGIAGLMGAGRTELARAVFGADKIDSGEILVNGKKVKINSPCDAIENGIGYLSEDRKKDGLALSLDIESNIVLANIKGFCSKFGVVNRKKCIEESKRQVNDIKIKTPSLAQKAKFLSGGNQQKVVIGKWLCRNTNIVIFDEPTRGIDVGAKLEVYTLMNKLVESGSAIIMISSELPEVLGMSDRILVMHEGEKTAELDINEANQEKILFHASGAKQKGVESNGNS